MITARIAKVFLFVGWLGVVLLGSVGPAQGKLVQWNLKDVTFDDGGTASGFFLVDADADNWLVGWDMTVEAGTAHQPPGYRFNSASEPFWAGPPEKNIVVVYSHTFLDLDPLGRNSLQLQLYFDHPLSDAGGRAALTYGFEGWTYCCNERYITGGEVVAVPEPSEGLFLALGLATLVGFSTRRRH